MGGGASSSDVSMPPGSWHRWDNVYFPEGAEPPFPLESCVTWGTRRSTVDESFVLTLRIFFLLGFSCRQCMLSLDRIQKWLVFISCTSPSVLFHNCPLVFSLPFFIPLPFLSSPQQVRETWDWRTSKQGIRIIFQTIFLFTTNQVEQLSGKAWNFS